ncbi:antibiotic resistance protein [Niallia circulans]|uniref:alpha/beta fold hydrolase n=1 Tax=Niallia TaxID=2837506 RepID=UPI00077C26C8|nr:alpha/beta hydrolase [Niallia circulans]MDR4318056.1 alpha/beta hydrolase [Niallia circulans]MED3838570.1 alpha/beta hydrolase [Niallia circulans]MED4244542.1 alpha/beta hydrolase [Niallia circulans]MED4249463.1 alpha/beta hydrolase [Niallia circulans]QKH59468.1 alpha/beta hydrolase [Niallia circulans]
MNNELFEKVLSKDGCNIHYWVSNKGKSSWLIFLHGAGADHEMFNEQVPIVSNEFNLLLWDARGHGLSRPMGDKFSIKLLMDDLVEIMNKEGIKKATFVGQSMGGNTAQEMAFYYPYRVEKLVLIDCTCNTMKLTGLERFYLNLTPLIIRMYPWSYLVNASVKASAIKPHVQFYLKQVFDLVGKKDFMKIFLATAACLHYEEEYKINKPILLVYGEHDQTGNIKRIASSWASSESNCRLFEISNASHCANQDNPSQFNTVFWDFLNDQ